MSFLKLISNFLPENMAYAHCDIPCGIYDPFRAQLAAHTIIRMTELLAGIKPIRHPSTPLRTRAQGEREDPSASSGQAETKAEHDIARMTHVKEEHSDILEEELETLRNDYFKEEHFAKYPNLNELFVKTLKSAGKARQNISLPDAEETLAGILEIAEIFFKTKDVEPIRVNTVYPTQREMVLYK